MDSKSARDIFTDDVVDTKSGAFKLELEGRRDLIDDHRLNAELTLGAELALDEPAKVSNVLVASRVDEGVFRYIADGVGGNGFECRTHDSADYRDSLSEIYCPFFAELGQ